MRTKSTTVNVIVAGVATTTVLLTTACSGPDAQAQREKSPSLPAGSNPSRTTTKSASPSSAASSVPSHQKASKPATTSAAETTASAAPPRKRVKVATKPPSNLPPSTPPKDQGSVLKKLPGTTKDTCVAVGNERDMTSGSLAMGNFQTARMQYGTLHKQAEQPTVDLYVIPKHRSMPGVSIKMTPITGNGAAKTVRSKDVEAADIWKYYSVHLPVPAPGSWRLDVRSGSDSGCFKVDFAK